MSYSTKTKMIVLFTLIVSFGFMGCQPVVTPIAPVEPTLSVTSFTVSADFTSAKLTFKNFSTFDFDINCLNGGVSKGTISSSEILGTGWVVYSTYASSVNPAQIEVYTYGETCYISIVDTSATYHKYLKIVEDGYTLTLTFSVVDTPTGIHGTYSIDSSVVSF